MGTGSKREIDYDEVKDWENGSGILMKGAKERIAELRERMRQNHWDPLWMAGECHLAEGTWRRFHHKGDYEDWLKEQKKEIL